MDVRTSLVAGAGALVVGAGALWHQANRSSVGSLADVIFAPHDRDGSGDVRLDGPLRPDDERAFDHPSASNINSSFFTLLEAADMLGNHNKVATRDEVVGLMRLADGNENGRLSRSEQKKLTHAARYTENYGSFASDKVTIRQAAEAITWHKPLREDLFSFFVGTGENVLREYPASRRD